MTQIPLIKRRENALGSSYKLFYDTPVHLIRGEGVWLFDADGRRYLDCYNNVASVGHCHPRIVDALCQQAGMLNTHTRYLHETVVEYAEALTAKLPAGLDACYFVCTGTEANDLAMRIARCVTGHHGAMVTEGSYHGNSTLVTQLSTGSYDTSNRPDWLSVVDPPNTFRGDCRDTSLAGAFYGDLVQQGIHNLEERGHKLAAYMVDTIFDANGPIMAPDGYFRDATSHVHNAGGLLIADEVQAGFCRTGYNWWGFENHGIVPDIITMGKPMGGGHPIGAVVTTRKIADKFAKSHGYFNTFGGNPVSARVGLEILKVLEEENILSNVNRTGAALESGLRKLMAQHPIIGDVRGAGLFWGIELINDTRALSPAKREAQLLANHMRDKGILLGVSGALSNVIKIRPPLVFDQTHADLLLEALSNGFDWLNHKQPSDETE